MKGNPQRYIVKYPNRRLYCPVECCYITLEYIERRIKQKQSITVIDKTTGQDITTGILMQILSRQEDRGQGKLTQGELLELIVKAPLMPAVRSAA